MDFALGPAAHLVNKLIESLGGVLQMHNACHHLNIVIGDYYFSYLILVRARHVRTRKYCYCARTADIVPEQLILSSSKPVSTGYDQSLHECHELSG